MQGRNYELKLCPSCNAFQDANKKECPNCGYDLTNVPSQERIKKSNLPSYTTSITIGIITIGIILFVVGLIALIMRGEITVKIVGESQIMHDFFWGGSSTEDTLTAIMVISGISMIIGLILFVIGIIKATSSK